MKWISQTSSPERDSARCQTIKALKSRPYCNGPHEFHHILIRSNRHSQSYSCISRSRRIRCYWKWWVNRLLQKSATFRFGERGDDDMETFMCCLHSWIGRIQPLKNTFPIQYCDAAPLCWNHKNCLKATSSPGRTCSRKFRYCYAVSLPDCT